MLGSVDGPPETALSCETLILKAKATERELIRTLAHLCRGISRKDLADLTTNDAYYSATPIRFSRERIYDQRFQQAATR